ncbi:hypothetical protein V8C37DRAFT_380593 [Trichoderma ceciliae]
MVRHRQWPTPQKKRGPFFPLSLYLFLLLKYHGSVEAGPIYEPHELMNLRPQSPKQPGFPANEQLNLPFGSTRSLLHLLAYAYKVWRVTVTQAGGNKRSLFCRHKVLTYYQTSYRCAHQYVLHTCYYM